VSAEDDATGGAHPDDLADRLYALAEQLRREQGESVPIDEPYLASRSAIRARVKRGWFRAVRPATRRYDRLASELAEAMAELATRLADVDGDVERLATRVRRLDRGSGAAAPPAGDTRAADGTTVPDEYYWRFEERMRGSTHSVVERLHQYERLAVPLREALEGERPPLWLDLGCGLGEFCELLGTWGWRVQGVDTSPGAVEAARGKGIEATLGDALGFLGTFRGEAPGAISAIQLIEHLPTQTWIPLFRAAFEALAPDGAFLVETINALNPEALARYFLADVTHTWPGHPETLRLMAEQAGFTSVEVVYLNPDDRGNPQDFAVWSVKG
jgi:SAM-dependent methyltransferase